MDLRKCLPIIATQAAFFQYSLLATHCRPYLADVVLCLDTRAIQRPLARHADGHPLILLLTETS